MDLTSIKAAALQAISPLKAATPQTFVPREDFLFSAKRTAAGKNLPEYYLVYFLLVDLLGFRNIGQFEKIAWAVPVDFRGLGFSIEHRKFGLGLFAADLPDAEAQATEIVELVSLAVKVAEPYFNWRAEQAVANSELNVVNNSRELFERFRFFSDRYDDLRAEAERRANERIRTDISKTAFTVSFPSFALRRQAKWFALATIESFFSWTEHVFILLAILQGSCITGEGVAKLAVANWTTKFRAALDLTDPDSKKFYDDLTGMRRQLRNLIAHGAFGKDGEAFRFHSGCGAVPVRLPHQPGTNSFRFGDGVELVNHDAITLIRAFIEHLWSGPRAPAKLYIQEHELPLILTMAASGEYRTALASDEAMTQLCDHLSQLRDQYANMDF